MYFKILLEKIQYPKLIVFALSILLSYILFQHHVFSTFAAILNGRGYASIFIAGFLFSYGFTAPIAVGFLIQLAPQVNIFAAAPIAGVGSLLADLLIFRFVRSSFQDEFDKLKLTTFFLKIKSLFDHSLSERIKFYSTWLLAGFVIASPLPDELGVSILSGITDIKQKSFMILSYALNTLGILLILKIAHA